VLPLEALPHEASHGRECTRKEARKIKSMAQEQCGMSESVLSACIARAADESGLTDGLVSPMNLYRQYIRCPGATGSMNRETSPGTKITLTDFSGYGVERRIATPSSHDLSTERRKLCTGFPRLVHKAPVAGFSGGSRPADGERRNRVRLVISKFRQPKGRQKVGPLSKD